MSAKYSPKEWPKAGAKLIYKGTHAFWFTNIIADAQRELVIGQTYTLKSIQVNSSWASVILEEFADLKFALSFFQVIEQAQDIITTGVSDRRGKLCRCAKCLIEETCTAEREFYTVDGNNSGPIICDDCFREYSAEMMKFWFSRMPEPTDA